MTRIALACLCLWGLSFSVAGAAEPGAHGHYLALTCRPGAAAPFAAVDLVYGPTETVDGVNATWWQLEAREKDEAASQPLFTLQALTDRDPLARTDSPMRFHRYLLRIPQAAECFEYRNVHTGKALLPEWTGFATRFVPVPARGSRFQEGLAETCLYLGHVLTLRHTGRKAAWTRLEAKVLELDPELLVGTSRSFRDKEEHRLPQKPERRNYTYIPFVAADYPVMIKAGMNLFIADGGQDAWIRGEPAFYIRSPGGKDPLRWPADFYRSNYRGPEMFMDEPTCIMVGEVLIHKTLRYFPDAAAVIEQRVRQGYRPGLAGSELEQMKVNLGSMKLEHPYPTWETMYDTAFYQMAGGAAGIVHEGRYQLAPFDDAIGKWLTAPRKHTAEQMLRYYYAFLRGATRPFEGHWGTAIYGQCDPAISPDALRIAYDMGARCLWFWTSDHDHHMPWPEQLELARTLKAHAAAHPRASIAGAPPMRDLAIVIPYGYFLSLDNLWWVRELDTEGKNAASARYRRLMQRAHAAIEAALEAGEDFDITVDDGREFAGYRRIVRVTDAE